jgi:hypothetical protein
MNGQPIRAREIMPICKMPQSEFDQFPSIREFVSQSIGVDDLLLGYAMNPSREGHTFAADHGWFFDCNTDGQILDAENVPESLNTFRVLRTLAVRRGKRNEYAHFDEFEDVVLALELVARLAPDVQKQPSLWKWIIIGLQNAVQAGMVLALAGTDGCGALTDKSQRLNREWLDKLTNQRPRRDMAPYAVLLSRVHDPKLMEGPALVTSREQFRNLERLNELRRGFAHFNPTGWGIEINYMLAIMPDALAAIEFLLEQQDRPQIHLSSCQKDRVRSALTTARRSFKAQTSDPASS